MCARSADAERKMNMEEKKKHIEITVDLCADTVRISMENVTGNELIDGYFNIAGAVAALISKNGEEVSKHWVICEVFRRGLLEYCEGEQDKED